MRAKNDLIKRFKKKSKGEDNRGSLSEVSEDYKRMLERAEKKFALKGKECDRIKATLKKERIAYKAKIRSLEKQLEEERVQREGGEIQLKGSHIHLDQATREFFSLRCRLHLEEGTPIPILLLECKECDHLIDHCRYLEATMVQKDMLIKNIIQKRDPRESKKMFEESKSWNAKNLCEGGPLAAVDWED